MLRVERWDNSHSMPSDYDKGTGQEREWVKTKPTKWYALFHHPDLWEGVCLRKFDSREKRNEYVKTTFRQYEELPV